MKKILVAILLALMISVDAFAHDTDLYIASGEGVEPNILIIIDNSNSMADEIQVSFYNPSTTYPGSKTSGAVYYLRHNNWNSVFKSSIGQVACSYARTALSTTGFYSGRISNSGCYGNNYSLRTGNYINYLNSIGGDEYKTKLEIAQQIIGDLIDSVSGVRVGIMEFNRIVYGNGPTYFYGQDAKGGKIVEEINSLGSPGSSTRTHLKNEIRGIVAESGTPLAETLYEAGLYFKGASSYFNPGVNYVSPIEYRCQRNYVIIMTDGDSTVDNDPILNTIGDQDRDGHDPGGSDPYHYLIGGVQDQLGTDYLDDVAKYLYDSDLRPDMEGKQNIITYTIGFQVDSQHQLLQRTATNGYGKYYYTATVQNLADAFSNILNEVLAKTSSFVAPIVPVSRLERTTAGDKIYLAFFKPNQTGMWSGNIKKYGVAQADNTSKGIALGDILDASGSKAVDSNGDFYPSSKSYWTTSKMDGGEVEVGGVGEVLGDRDFTSNPRKIYSFLGQCEAENIKDLTDPCNAFTPTNANIRYNEDLGVASEDEKIKLINFIRGIDSYDDNLNNDKTEKRDWLLGSFLHSRPTLIFYKDQTVIYAGANDGMLHAFDDATGEELWAYIPGSLLGNLYQLHTDNPPIFVDGSPKAYVSYDSDGRTVNRAILIFGLRRGGTRYYALDVTDPQKPIFAWHIDKDISGYSEMGLAQTWSTPVIGKVKVGTADKWVAFIGGGYDTGQDDDNPTDDSMGRAIYVVNVLDGSLVKRFSHNEYGNMDYSIPSDIAKLDINGDGYVDRLYVGDMNGCMWRFDIGNSDTSKWQGNIIFHSNSGLSEKRKIFYPPDITLEREDGVNYEMLFFGTGNREDPKGNKDMDRIYAVKDKNSDSASGWTDLGETNLVNVTDFYTNAPVRDAIYNDKTKYGWYLKLDKQDGEKCLASPLVYAKVAYYTTFAPTQGDIATDPCFVGEGTAYLYAVNYRTGEAVLNLDGSLDGAISKTDRSVKIGTAIPSGVVVTVIGGEVTGYSGVGGGVYRVKLTDLRSLFPLHWKLVF